MNGIDLEFLVDLEIDLPCSQEDYVLTFEESEEPGLLQSTRQELSSLLIRLYSPNQPYSELCRYVNQLWRLADYYETKKVLLEPKYHLITFFHAILSSPIIVTRSIEINDPNIDLLYQTVGSVWFLSRAVENRPLIGAKVENLLTHLIKLITLPKYSRMILNILMNCSLDESNHSYLTSNELGYLEYIESKLIEEPDNVELYRAVNYLSLSVKNDHVLAYQRHKIPSLIFKHLLKLRENPAVWPDRASGGEYWALNIMMDISVQPLGALILQDIGVTEYFMSLIITYCRFDHYYKIEQAKAMIILVNICYFHLSSSTSSITSFCLSSSSSITHHRRLNYQPLKQSENLINFIFSVLLRRDHRNLSLFEFLLDIYFSTVEYPDDRDNRISYYLIRRGWAFGIMTARTLTTFFRNLFGLERYLCYNYPDQHNDKIITFQTFWKENYYVFLKAHLHLLTLYTQYEESLRIFEGTGFIQGGGGKNDHDVVEVILDNIIQICFYYNELENTFVGSQTEEDENKMEVIHEEDDEDGEESAFKPLLSESPSIKNNGIWREMYYQIEDLINRAKNNPGSIPLRIIELANISIDCIRNMRQVGPKK